MSYLAVRADEKYYRSSAVTNLGQRVWPIIYVVPASEASLPALCLSVLGLKLYIVSSFLCVDHTFVAKIAVALLDDLSSSSTE